MAYEMEGVGKLVREILIVAIPVAAGAVIYAAGLFRFDVQEVHLIWRRVSAS
ncbi:MAG: hypothetical protein R2849_07280 [Thermomicrobiales bacterium]